MNIILIQIIRDVKTSNSNLRLYIMSNISKISLLHHFREKWLISLQKHFEMIQNINLHWLIFDKLFASEIESMRKSNLCFYQHFIKKIEVHSSEIIMIDDTNKNICATRSQNMHTILMNKFTSNVEEILLNLLQDSFQRVKAFFKNNARNHYCIVEDHEKIRLKNNFAQLMIWKLTDDEDIIYLKWLNNKMHEIYLSNDHVNDHLND